MTPSILGKHCCFTYCQLTRLVLPWPHSAPPPLPSRNNGTGPGPPLSNLNQNSRDRHSRPLPGTPSNSSSGKKILLPWNQLFRSIWYAHHAILFFTLSEIGWRSLLNKKCEVLTIFMLYCHISPKAKVTSITLSAYYFIDHKQKIWNGILTTQKVLEDNSRNKKHAMS